MNALYGIVTKNYRNKSLQTCFQFNFNFLNKTLLTLFAWILFSRHLRDNERQTPFRLLTHRHGAHRNFLMILSYFKMIILAIGTLFYVMQQSYKYLYYILHFLNYTFFKLTILIIINNVCICDQNVFLRYHDFIFIFFKIN